MGNIKKLGRVDYQPNKMRGGSNFSKRVVVPSRSEDMKYLIVVLMLVASACSRTPDLLHEAALVLEDAAAGHTDVLGASADEQVVLHVRALKVFEVDSEAWQTYLLAVSTFYLEVAQGQADGVYVLVGQTASGEYFTDYAFAVDIACLKTSPLLECLSELGDFSDIKPLVLWPGLGN